MWHTLAKAVLLKKLAVPVIAAALGALAAQSALFEEILRKSCGL